MFRPRMFIINLALEHFKKNITITNARNEISFLQIVSRIFHAALEEHCVELTQ